MYSAGINQQTLTTLDKIARIDIAKKYYLAGGTACALHLGHRQSSDLDFFSESPLDPPIIRNQLISLGKLEIIQNDQGTFNGSLDTTKISFFVYPYQLLDKTENYHDIQISSIRDLACMKLESISSRGAKRDFIDLYFIAQLYPLTEMFSWFETKFSGQQVSKTNVLKSLIYFEDARDDPMPIMHHLISWEKVKQYFLDIVPSIAHTWGL